ncbi:MAG TPA: hypothetical protein VL551_29420 [Actinospica sp.]|jgi:hypothetical protein|nr:hypothetical protein [Actinospica sp.]
MDRRPDSGPSPGGKGATPSDLRDLSPAVARQLLVETLLRIGLDLHAALALAVHEPVRRQVRDALRHVDEALRQVRLAAIEQLSDESAPERDDGPDDPSETTPGV